MIPETHIESVRSILDAFQNKGFRAYIVGGAVRDIMLGTTPSDMDIMTNATADEIQDLFSDRKVKRVGKTFPVCLVDGIEISSSRTGFDVQRFPESDLGRRDFTINAMAFDPVQQTILDPFNGRKDLQDSIIRFTQDPVERIREDPVRMVRACRFLALLEGRLSLSTLEAVSARTSLLDGSVAKERIRYEILKAMAVKKPSLFFRALRETGLLEKIFPSLDRCYDLDGGAYHGETVFHHMMLVGDALPERQPLLRLAGFLHDTGKFDAAEIKSGKLQFAGHETHTDALVRDLETLRFSGREIAYIVSLARCHMRPLTEKTTPKAARRLLSMLGEHNLGYRDFLRMRIADKKGNLAKDPYTMADIRTRLEKLQREIKASSSFRMDQLEITGTDIIRITGVDPGPEVGRIKKMLFERVLDDPELNTYDRLKQLCETLNRDSN